MEGCMFSILFSSSDHWWADFFCLKDNYSLKKVLRFFYMYTFYQEENSFSEEYGESGIPINVSTT